MESDRDQWISALHTASYECMKMQLDSLREQIVLKTGRDPLVSPHATPVGNSTLGTVAISIIHSSFSAIFYSLSFFSSYFIIYFLLFIIY